MGKRKGLSERERLRRQQQSAEDMLALYRQRNVRGFKIEPVEVAGSLRLQPARVKSITRRLVPEGGRNHEQVDE